jgi:hypothetical protein
MSEVHCKSQLCIFLSLRSLVTPVQGLELLSIYCAVEPGLHGSTCQGPDTVLAQGCCSSAPQDSLPVN